MADIHDLRTLVAYLRRSVWPLREAVTFLEKTESALIKKGTKVLMNFEHMPELRYPWAYPAVWAAMIGVVCVMLGYFRRKRWL